MSWKMRANYGTFLEWTQSSYQEDRQLPTILKSHRASAPSYQKRNAKCKMISSMPSSHPSPMASPTTKLQRLQHRQPSLLQATLTSQFPRKLRQLQVILLLQATSSRELHHHPLQPMRPSRQVPSNASHAEDEATSPMSAPTSGP